MGYRICYDSSTVITKRMWNVRIWKKVWIVGCLFLAAITAALCIIPQSRSAVLELIVPGDSQATVQAMGNLVDAVGGGVPIGAALADFCRDILESA